MRICPKCNGAGIQFVPESSFGGPCPSCMGTGREREPVLVGPPGAAFTEPRPDVLHALLRIADTARAVEKWMHAHAREANCDIVNDDHEQLRSALHNLDMLVSTSAKEKP